MSTLLKKKYCRNNAIGDSAAVVQVIPCTMTEHNRAENSYDIDETVARNDASKNNSVASAISTVTDEEDNAVDESPSTTARLLSLSSSSSSSLTASNDSTTNKSVRFDEETVITINASTIEEDSYVVQKYRNDIWYQVSHCTLVSTPQCMTSLSSLSLSHLAQPTL
jgi:hypothetical protein